MHSLRGNWDPKPSKFLGASDSHMPCRHARRQPCVFAELAKTFFLSICRLQSAKPKRGRREGDGEKKKRHDYLRQASRQFTTFYNATHFTTPRAQNALGRSTMRLPQALLPRDPTWESSHFSGLAIIEKQLGEIKPLESLPRIFLWDPQAHMPEAQAKQLSLPFFPWLHQHTQQPRKTRGCVSLAQGHLSQKFAASACLGAT